MLSSRGFTLIEALVALLVLSISLLGLAGMQLKGLQSGHVAYQRAVADLAAQDAGERLWESLGDPDISSTCPTGDDLSNLQQAWIDNWTDDLPGFSNSTLEEGETGCRFDVTVSWDDERFTYLNDEDNLETENVSKLTYTVVLPNA